MKTQEIQELALWDKLTSNRKPISFELEVTARCNNNCQHCHINLSGGDREARDRELNLAEIERIADEAVELGVISCLITGGEPLIRSDFPDIYLSLKKKGLLVSVFTNATPITLEHVKLFKHYPPRDIEVTVYGVTQKTYDEVAQKVGMFERFMRGLSLMEKYEVPVRLKAMVMRANLHEYSSITEFCMKHGKDYVRYDPNLHLRYDNDFKRNEEIRTQRLTPDEIIALEKQDLKGAMDILKQVPPKRNKEMNYEKSVPLLECGAGTSQFNVSYDGQFRLCHALWADGTTYDLRSGSIHEAWYEFVPKVRALQGGGLAPECQSCQIRDKCFRCPARAHLETGQLDGYTPYFCAVTHGRVEWVKSIPKSLCT